MAYMSGEIGCCQQLETANDNAGPDPDIWAKSLSGIGDSEVSQTYDIENLTTHAHGVVGNPGGTKIFVGSMSGTLNDYVIESSLSTAWDLSTASTSTTAGDHLSTSTWEGLLGGIDFCDDGEKLITFGRNTVDRWDLSTAYDISTATHQAATFSVTSQTSMMYDGYMRNDGLKMYVVGYQPDEVHEYTLSTAYALNTASFVQSEAVASGVSSGLHFSSDGYAFVVYDNQYDVAKKYNLSTAWDISTASLHSTSDSFGSTEGTGGGIWFDDDWNNMYLVGEVSDELHRIILTAVTAAPAAPSISTASTSQLNLSWSSVSGAASYKVFRSATIDGTYSLIASGITATSYNNTGLTAGTKYYYKLRATNSEGDSSLSPSGNRYTLPNQVTGLAASAQSNTQINLSWNEPSGFETGYKIERSTSSGSGFSQIANINGSLTAHNDTGLTLNTTYYYKIRAYTDPGGDGAYSSEASDTTQNNASAPTSVSIATTSSGNYDNAVLVVSKNTGAAGEDPLVSNDGSTFSSNSGIIEVTYGQDYSAVLNNCGGQLRFHTEAYLRASGATSYQWDIDNVGFTDQHSIAIASTGYVGSPGTTQDSTGAGGVGEDVVFNHNSGGRGYHVLSQGDTMTWECEGTATNNSGNTNAQTISIALEVS